MEGDFYRRIPDRWWFRNGMKKLSRSRRRIFFIILGLLLLFYLLFDNKGIIARIQLEMQKQELTRKVEEAEEEAKRLEERMKALQGDKQTIEKIARERHGMAREGETVYRIKKD